MNTILECEWYLEYAIQLYWCLSISVECLDCELVLLESILEYAVLFRYI